MKRTAVSAMWLAFALGCATGEPLHTSSGKPEVTIAATKKDVTNALIAQMSTRGFSLDTATDYQVRFNLPTDNTSTTALFVGPIKYRWNCDLLDAGGKVRVVASVEFKTRGDWEQTPQTPYTTAFQGKIAEVMAALDATKTQLESR